MQTGIRSRRRQFMLAAAALGASGCFGKFSATTALYDWNKDISPNKWLRWLVFLVLIILPVYGLFMLADAIVLNTIEFWTGNNPIGGGHAELEDGHTVTSMRTDDPDVIRHEVRKDGELVRVVHARRVGDREMQLLDAEMRVLARARLAEDGSIELRDAEGKLLSSHGAGVMDRAALALDAGAAPTQAVLHATGARDRDHLLAESPARRRF